MEQQKFKTSLIIEAIKVGDKQKAIDNLNFFIDAGFLDDPEGKIRGLLKKNAPPVLPTTWVSKNGLTLQDWLSLPVDGDDVFAKAFGSGRLKLVGRSEREKKGDELAAKGDTVGAASEYRSDLLLDELFGRGSERALRVRSKLEKLPEKPTVPPCTAVSMIPPKQ